MRAELIYMVKKGLFRRSQIKASGERRSLKERGASMVEFALVAPLFFAIVFSGIEMGLMFRNYLAVENLSRSAARIASIERDAPDADQLILQRIDELTSGLQGNVTTIVIFKADSLSQDVPADCIVAPRAGSCNSYEVIDGDVGAIAATAQTAWASTSRSAFDNVGIHIEMEYQFVTGFFDTIDISTTTIEVIEQDV